MGGTRNDMDGTMNSTGEHIGAPPSCVHCGSVRTGWFTNDVVYCDECKESFVTEEAKTVCAMAKIDKRQTHGTDDRHAKPL